MCILIEDLNRSETKAENMYVIHLILHNFSLVAGLRATLSDPIYM